MQPQSSVPNAYTVSAPYGQTDANFSGVSWPAIFAGTVAAAALSYILALLGFGLGLSAISPWENKGVSAETFGTTTIIWLAITQVIAGCMGGYLAGRLRVKWSAVHNDEVYFRDTAHGMLVWAVSTLLTVVFLSSAATSIIKGGVKAGSEMVSGAANLIANHDLPNGKISASVNSLFRSDQPSNEADNKSTEIEAGKVIVNSINNGGLSNEDKSYLGHLIAKRTGVSEAEAEKRVADVYAQTEKTMKEAEIAAKEALNKARKVAAMAALWMFVAHLCGAFFSSIAATWGGKQRDNIPVL